MIFRTEISPVNEGLPVCHEDAIMLVGSCFAESMGQKLKEGGFRVNINPWGVLYNPFSVSECLEGLIRQESFGEQDVFFHEGMWYSYSFHGRYARPGKEECLTTMNEAVTAGSAFLQKASVLIITFGTAWVYELAGSKKVVANCHRMPSHYFTRRLLSFEEIVNRWRPLMQLLREFNPGLKILFTLSPVRYFQEGACNNSLSKAVLRLAIHQLKEERRESYYFPSYELLMDDLRDYRFYAADLCHPSEEAINYVWEKFCGCYFTGKTMELVKKVNRLYAALDHRPLYGYSSGYIEFLRSCVDEINLLVRQHPQLSIDELKKEFEARLSSCGSGKN